ncbi:MAG: hypothetical protein GYA87_05550 [Christensenellaceae bacterium]|nr:hypothetical protein [Christensenellaceae bacterium]
MVPPKFETQFPYCYALMGISHAIHHCNVQGWKTSTQFCLAPNGKSLKTCTMYIPYQNNVII